ncbi:MAG: DNA cytosine methyltransferase [Alphaproteobacteria bacterium]|nr:DNA cytosine methyltransferase [Alphaproteobacteria bacterium]
MGTAAVASLDKARDKALCERHWPQDSLNCVDLFAGAGGFSLAATKARLTVRLAIELQKHAASTYRDNLCKSDPRPHLIEGDIRDLDPVTLSKSLFADGQPCDLILGGPPCQGFSAHRLNNSGVDDARNNLIHVYFDFVRAFSPTVFLMENVPGMLWPRHKEALDRFYREGDVAGYDVKAAEVLDARDYGVPQRRKRVFILGVRRGLDTIPDWPPAPTHGNDAARRASPALSPWVSCREVFKPAPENDPNDTHMKHTNELVRIFEQTPPNGGSRHQSGRTLKCHQGHDGHNDVYGRINPDEPAPTMTTACINPSKGRFVHPTLHHGITVRQAARIQTFPDEFVFGGGLMAAGEQVGNAVPVALAQLLIEHLKPILAAAREQAARLAVPAKRVTV